MYNIDDEVWRYEALDLHFSGTPSVTIDSGTLSISLDAPLDSEMNEVSWYENFGAAVTPPDARISREDMGFYTSDGAYYLECTDDNGGSADLVYADKDATISGAFILNGLDQTFDVTLRKGWNFWIMVMDTSAMTVAVTASPTQPDGFVWTVYSNPDIDPDCECMDGGNCLCGYDDDETANAKYGRLYDWQTAKDSAPAGWHLPTDDEWETLVDFAGGADTAAGKLKAATNDWNWNPDYGGTDEYGFTALPGGFYSSIFLQVRQYGYWWSASENDDTSAWSRSMGYSASSVTRAGDSSKDYFFSVRYVKD